MEQMTLGQFNRLADQHRILVAYPDGVDRGWNDGRSDLKTTAVKEGVDDIGFLRAVVNDIEKQHPIDRARIYATGISNGGLMSYRLACDAADLVSAIATVAANLSVDLSRECRPARSVPVAIINGTDDPMMPWLGGDIEVLLSRRGVVLSSQETFEYWAKRGDCALPNTHMQFRDKSAKGTTVIRHVARDCIDGTEVRLYEIVGGGHTWPSGYQYLGERIVGKTSRELKASSEIWSFFARNRR
jgi:polyhydroxybutyrate depolymerase